MPPFMQPDSSLPCSQEPSAGPYPEQDLSTPSLRLPIRSVLPE
jgi:hypothetical protein